MTLSHLPIAQLIRAHRWLLYRDDGRRDDRVCGESRPDRIESARSTTDRRADVPRLLEAIHSRVMRTVETVAAVSDSGMFRAAIAVDRGIRICDSAGNSYRRIWRSRWRCFRRIVFAKSVSIFGSRLRYLISSNRAPSATTVGCTSRQIRCDLAETLRKRDRPAAHHHGIVASGALE